jgi:hypothetical protein
LEGAMMKQSIIFLFFATLVFGCASIQHSTSTEQPIGEKIIAGVGDIVLGLNKKRNLENVLGKADIFGRKTNEGFSELRFAGVESSGEVVLYRKNVHVLTNETTMSKAPISRTTGSTNTNLTGSFYGNGNHGNINSNATTNYTSTTTKPTSDYHVFIPSETIPIRLAPGETKFHMEGYVVEIIKATTNSITYKINKH